MIQPNWYLSTYILAISQIHMRSSINNFAICNSSKSDPSYDDISYFQPSFLNAVSASEPFFMRLATWTSFLGNIDSSKSIFEFQMDQSFDTMCDGTFDYFVRLVRFITSKHGGKRGWRRSPVKHCLGWRGEKFHEKRRIRTRSTPLIQSSC